MNIRFLSLIAAVAMSVSAGAMAQAVADPTQSAAPAVAASAVGRWLYDAQGHILGNVRSLDANGRTAVIMVGTYFQDGSHLATVPASALSIVNNRVTLRTDTVEALNTVRQR